MQLLFGWNESLDVPTAVQRTSTGEALQRSAVLLTMVDSDPDVAGLPSIRAALDAIGTMLVPVGRGVVFSFEALVRLTAVGFLTGFDEVWFCHTRPVVCVPSSVRLTSDVTFEAPSPELERWMDQAQCIAGLGDGDGLNWVTSSAELARVWRG